MGTSNHFRILNSQTTGYRIYLGVLFVLVVAGWFAAHAMETEGHWITGMNNQVVWGLPHVFAIFLIVSASGALNVASLSSVFGNKDYSPWSRLSGLLAVCLLVGGLIVLVLDLGRPERLVVAMTHYNFKSIFAWNIFLYSGFIVVVAVYLWTQFQRNLEGWVGRSGLLAFLWRFILTSGTGAIFGFLVARQYYDAAIMIPLFIVLSLVLGTAVFLLVSTLIGVWFEDGPGADTIARLGRLLGVFIAAKLFLVAAFHLTNLYATEHHGIERFILLQGGIYTSLFWIGQVALGSLMPLAILFLLPSGRTTRGVLSSAVLAIIGGLSLLYVTIIGGQAYPLVLFPGKKVSSSFHDGEIVPYLPSAPEWILGVGGVALALLLILLAIRVLPFLPDNRRFRSAV